MAQLRNPAREAWLELQILDLLREAPLSQTMLNKRLGIDPKLIKKALARQEGICVIRRQDGAWELLPEPGDIPEENVEFGLSEYEKMLLQYEDKLIAKGIQPFQVGYSKQKKSFYWDELITPDRVQVGDCLLRGIKTQYVRKVEFLGSRLHRGEFGDYWRITCSRTAFYEAQTLITRRIYDQG